MPWRYHHKQKYTEQERLEAFWSHVKKGDPDQCWVWDGCKDGLGYGMFRLGGLGVVRCHRIAMMLFLDRELNRSEKVLHKCDNPSCCNPHHLYVGTQQDNVNDRESRGRSNRRRGLQHGGSKATEQEVIKIRRLYYGSRCRLREIAIDFPNLSMSCIWSIISGKTWSHIDAGVECRRRGVGSENNGHAKLTNEQVTKMRRSWKKRDDTKKELADKYTISLATVNDILSGRTWKNLL